MTDTVLQFLDWLQKHWVQEWTVITSAPAAFVVAVLLISALSYASIRWYFQHEINSRDSVIAARDAVILVHEERHKLQEDKVESALLKATTSPSEVDLQKRIDDLKTALMPPQPLIVLQDTRLDPRVPDTNTGITYKAKVVATFLNRSDRTVLFLSPNWIVSKDDIGVQSPFDYRYRRIIEGRQLEFKETLIEPNEKFTIWIGLDKSISHNELEQRRKDKRLGLLRIPVKVENAENDLVFRL